MTREVEHDYIPVREASRHIPGRPHRSTILRWVRKKKLEAVVVGGRLFITKEAIERFMRSTYDPIRAKQVNRRGLDVAEAQLHADGFFGATTGSRPKRTERRAVRSGKKGGQA